MALLGTVELMSKPSLNESQKVRGTANEVNRTRGNQHPKDQGCGMNLWCLGNEKQKCNNKQKNPDAQPCETNHSKQDPEGAC